MIETTKLAIGVDPHPTSQEDHAASRHDARGNQSVGQHVLERAADVEVALAAGSEHPGGDPVDQDADSRHRHDRVTLHAFRLQQTAHGLGRHSAGDQQKHHGVEQGRPAWRWSAGHRYSGQTARS